MTKADIVEQVSEATGLTKVETEAVVDGVIFYIKDSLQRGERVDMRRFGSFFVNVCMCYHFAAFEFIKFFG